MISIFGSAILFLAFLFSLIGIGTLVLGRFSNNDSRYIKSGSNALLGSAIIVIISFITLLSQFLSDTFHLKFVADTSSIATPTIYKIGALWAGSTGSLLLWSTIVAAYKIYFILSYRKKYPEIFTTTLIIIGLISTCFLGFIYFLQNPFEPVFNIIDGRGTGPNLQHILMLIHPPLLYSGYIGFLIPFSMTLAALIENQDKIDYVSTNRKHVLFAWLVLTVAIILGGRWAYLELGWGGYWAWDPVENASLMPWLVSTAYLHSILVEQQRGMLRLWNVVLISMVYCLTILGVYLVRGGLIAESVHSFAESPIGGWFLALFFILLIFSIVTIILKSKSLKPRDKIESFTSRESGFLYNNVLFVGITFFILFAIFQPIFSSILTDKTVKLVDQAGYNRIAAIFGFLLLMLMGVAPFLAWRKTSKKVLKKIFIIPLLFSIAVSAITLLIFIILKGFSWMSVTVSIYAMLIAFVAYGIFDEFIRAAYVRYKNKNENIFIAFLQLFRINQSRYGGYIVHIGFLIMTIGFIGRGFETKNDYTVSVENPEKIDDYTILISDYYIEKSNNINMVGLANQLIIRNEIPDIMRDRFIRQVSKLVKKNESRSNHFAEIVELDIENNNNQIKLPVEKRFYYSPVQVTKEIALESNIVKDLYIILNRVDYDKKEAYITVWINYLVNWVWVGTLIILIGGLISLAPFRRKRSNA